uniref:Si:ch211-207e14.4 n=1 Tax=Cynoglossus semilaevis TaxID=244447 RepID=A0A3P8US06_CYNSE
CVPWPCLALVGKEDPHICQHYVQAPTDVTVELVQDSNPTSDSVVISWKPSYYIAFLRGFQVILQALGGSTVACQLLLFHRNLSLPVSHAERVYRSDPFHGLSLDSQYAVTVMALPVPEEWEKFYKNKIFSTRCAEKNGLEACKKWYPEQVKVQHDGIDISVTFNLAPEELGISSYFSLCYTSGMKTYTDIKPILKQHEDSTGQEEVVLLPGRRATPPRLLLCYSSRDGAAHVKAVLQLGAFIQQHMATQVCLDLWDSLSVAEEGSVVWHCRQIRESDFILVICSKGLNYRHQSPASGSQEEEEAKMFGTFSSDAVVQLIREEVCQAKARGQDLSKYMAAIFEYSEETDIPTELRLVPHYTLTSDLPLLFSHLHSVALHQPGGYLKIGNMSEEGFSKLPAGAALQTAI